MNSSYGLTWEQFGGFLPTRQVLANPASIVTIYLELI